MIITLKIYEHDVIVTNNIAQTKDKDFERLLNMILDIQGFPVSMGYVPQLFETFGKDIEIIEVIENEKNAIY